MPPSWLRGASRYLKDRRCRVQSPTLQLQDVPFCKDSRNGFSYGWPKAARLSSLTAVNASKNIPTEYGELHEALHAVKKHAAAYVDLSRLDLALQGLETGDFITRVAVLGINGTTTARRVMRLSLADPLKKQETWEGQLDGPATTTGILLKYGELRDTSLASQRTAIETLSVQSRFLEKYNIQILIGSVSIPDLHRANGNLRDVPIDVLLSPAIDIPTSSTGRLTQVRFPVHKSIILADGFDELLQGFQLLFAAKIKLQGNETLIDVVLNTEGSLTGLESKSVVAINSSTAGQGLEMVRKDLSKASDFEHHWLESGLDSVVKKLCSEGQNNSQQLPALLKNLVWSILSEASSTIDNQAYQSSQTAKSTGLSESTRIQLQGLLDSFSLRAHAELQSGIEAACSSKNWKKLAWYKLFWRVDDVSLIISDLVERYWLPRSERAICELTGRLVQAGLSLTPSSEPITPASTSTPTNRLAIDLIESQGHFWDLRSSASATEISDARRALTHLSSLDLTEKAQSALAKMLALSGGSAVFAALTYVSSPLSEFYESGTILAFGIVFALRKLQTDWESYRRYWRQRLFEAGSDTLKEVEVQTRRLINDGGKASEDSVDTELRREAQRAVKAAQEALKRLE